MGIASKIAAAARACRYVQKDAANAFHKYRYASAANILEHVNEALFEAGLAVVETSPEIVSTEGTGKERVVTVRMRLVVADTESDERATFVGLGSGMDAGDKAVMKAETAATKYAWMVAFSISAGDDPEADASTDERSNNSGARPASQRAPQKPRAQAAQQPANHVADAADPNRAPAPADPSPALEAFHARLAEVELPGEAVQVWMKVRASLAPLPVPDREAAWKALCRRTEEVGKMKNASAWLKKAVQEEEAILSRGQANGTDAA